jgi:hypothetical protein
LSAEIRDLEQKIAALPRQADPAAIMTPVPGVGVINAAQILARPGDPGRFRSLAGARSCTGLVPSLNASGVSGHHGPPTKSGDAPLREALFMAADHARRTDPTPAARYYRLMVCQGKHHNSALCHISTALLTRIIACWRAGTHYQIRDTDGTPLATAQGRAIVAARYRVRDDIRAQRRTSHHDPRRQDRHRRHRTQQLPAGHRRRDRRGRAPHHQPRNRPLQGLRHPPQKAVTSMPAIKLDVTDAAELAEMLQFLSQWLGRDPARLAASLEEFVGHPAYGTGQLRQDMERFVFLLGGSDGEPLFGLPPQ